MGSAMASNLLKAGHKTVVCDPAAEAAVAELTRRGAQVAHTPVELGLIPGLSAVVSMLPSPQAVREAYLGRNGLLTGEPQTLHPSLLIDSSTIDPGTAREVADAAEGTLLHPDAAESCSRRYPQMIDAPVSGGVPAAMSATLTFMASHSLTHCLLAILHVLGTINFVANESFAL